MIEGQPAQEMPLFGRRGHFADDKLVGHDGAVREHHATRRGRCAGRVLQDGQIIQAGPLQHAVARQVAVVNRDPARQGQTPRDGGKALVGRQQIRGGQHKGGIAILNHPDQTLALRLDPHEMRRRRGHRHHSRQKTRVQGDDAVQSGRKQQHDPASRLAMPGQQPCQAGRPPQQLGIRDFDGFIITINQIAIGEGIRLALGAKHEPIRNDALHGGD